MAKYIEGKNILIETSAKMFSAIATTVNRNVYPINVNTKCSSLEWDFLTKGICSNSELRLNCDNEIKK